MSYGIFIIGLFLVAGIFFCAAGAYLLSLIYLGGAVACAVVAARSPK